MNLYSGGKSIISFPELVMVKNISDFAAVVKTNHYVFAEFKDGLTTSTGYPVTSLRSNENWIRSNCLYADFDDGYRIKDFQIEFEKYEYYLTTSVNHRKTKKDEKACDRFHVVFPIHEVTDINQHKGYLKILNKYFLYGKLDKNCIDTARKFAPSGEDSTILYNKGKSIGTIIHRLWENEPVQVPKPIPVISSSYNRNIISKLDIALDHGWFDDYMAWIQLGMALKSSGFDVSTWQRYSYTSEDKKKAVYRWQGFSDDGNITLQYLLDICKNVQKYYRK